MIELKIQDEGHGWTYRLGDREKVLIGRAPTNDIQIREGRSSRVHCQIEKVPEGYKLVDLESRNGTRVNDEVVNSRLLHPGDQVQIGQTVIQFGEPCEPVPVAAAPKPPSEKEQGGPALQTVRIDKRPSHHRIVPPARRSQFPWEILVIGGGVLAALVIGTFVYRLVSTGQERDRALKAASQAWSEVAQEYELGPRIARMKEAIDRYENVARLYPDSSEGAQAKAQLKRIEPEYKRLVRWRRAYQDVLHSRKMAGDAPDLDQLMYWEAQLKKIEESCPIGSLSAQAGLERESIAKCVDSAAKRLIEQQRKDLEVILASEDYAAVLMKWELFRERYSRFPALVKDVEAEVKSVKGKVEASFLALEEKVDRLIEEKRFAEATAMLERARERFIGTEAAAKTAMKAEVVNLVSRGREDRGKAEEIVKARKEIYLSAAEAEAFARRREWARAIAIYRDILASTADAEVRAEFSRRVEEMEAIQALFTRFIGKASSGSLKNREWILGPGTVVLVSNADREWVHFALPNHSGSTQKRWKAFTSKELANLLGLAVSRVEDRYTLALFSFRNNMIDRGEAILVEVLREAPEFRARIFEILSRIRGEPIPEGGYVVYKGRWFTRAERDRAAEDDRIQELVDRILKKSVSEAAGAVGKLSAMQRGRKPLVEALYKKREILKKKMARDLRFDNQALINLKREIDRRRAEALDFIEDESRYPDKKKMEAEGRMGEYWKIQKEEVDTRVKAVREIWENPYSAAVRMNPASKSINRELKKVNEWLAREDKTFDPKKADEVDMDYIASLANTKLNIKTFSTVSREQKLIAYNIAVMEWNGKNKTATAVERKQVEITNEYRWMLGRRCVKIEDMLVKAARGHSIYMSKTGKFAHRIPGHPDGESPPERCRNAGYTGGATSENISYNHSDPQGTFIAWYNSSGHHRNMINRNWAVLGAGLDGPHWTQNFGSADSTRNKPGSPSGGNWPGIDWRGGKAKRKSK